MRSIAATLIFALSVAASARAADQRAMTLVRAGLEAQGGEARLRSIRTLQWDAIGYRNQLEESERPEGPYITEFNESIETHDLAGNRFRQMQSFTVYPSFTVPPRGMVVADGIAMRVSGDQRRAGSADMVAFARERMALSPERLLLTALAAPDLSARPDTVLQSVPHNVVTFMLDGSPVTVFLNANTHLPTAWDYSGPLARRGFWNYLGDAKLRTYWGFWWLCKGGVRLPMQWNTFENGLPDGMMSIKRVALDAPLDDAALVIPGAVRAGYDPAARPADLEAAPLGDPKQSPIELRPGIVFIPGLWNATFVNQDDGVVILEAPISSGYSAKVIAAARARFPAAPIKAVVTTSDSWPHLAGIREYVAEGVPIYALDLNRPILDRIIAAPHTSKPDTLARRPRKPLFHLVSGPTAIGTGPNRIVLYPLRGETSERQMMAYFPKHRLLYGSDPFQQNSDGSFFYPQTVSELVNAVSREGLAVDQFFMMHVGPTPWAKLPAALTSAAAQDTPNGKL